MARTTYGKFSKANLICTLRRQIEALQTKHGFVLTTGYAQVVRKPTDVQVAYGQWEHARWVLRTVENGMLDNAAEYPIEYSQEYSPISGKPLKPGSRKKVDAVNP